jgi:murein DD-endopeptidase MepM/ murein hydrolase activator NlpD
VPKSPHYGIDYAAPTGSPVIAPADGVVTFAHNDLFYSGGTLIIDHGHGLSSTFLHLSEILVKPNQQVTLGMEIAKVGATGRATGPHLDWRMNWLDQRIDPDLVLKVLPSQ